jgi:hypothetical protein
MPTEKHPGIRGYLPRFNVTHAAIPLSLHPQAQQGVPSRHFTRAGVRAAYTALSVTPPEFAFLLAQVRQAPRGAMSARALVAKMQPPIGVLHNK